MIAFTEEELRDKLQSTKYITDNLSKIKLDIHVFQRKFDIKDSRAEQCLAEGFVYIDDMLTFNHANKKEYFLLKLQLMGDATGQTWFVVDLINNNLKNGVYFDESLSLDK